MTVGPHPLPWPMIRDWIPNCSPRVTPGNVEDRFRYWRREAIIAELGSTGTRCTSRSRTSSTTSSIGSVVRTANAFNVAAVHRRAPQVEPARSDGHRPLPARRAP